MPIETIFVFADHHDDLIDEDLEEKKAMLAAHRGEQDFLEELRRTFIPPKQ